MRLLGVLTALLVASCTSGGAFVCRIDGDCADGAASGTCEANGYCSFGDSDCTSGRRYGALAGGGLGGVCVGDEPPSPDGSTSTPDGTTSTPDGGTPAATCGTTDILVDDFATTARSRLWAWSWDDTGSMAAETGGQLVITLVGAQPAARYAGYGSELTLDFRGKSVSVEVVQAPNPATDAEGFFAAEDADGKQVHFQVVGGDLRFGTEVSGTTSTLHSIPYVAATHRFWRLRESGGMIYWDTASNGSDWMMRHSAASPLGAARTRFSIFAGTYQAETAPGQMIFDNFNAGAPAASFCPIADLTDDFDDGSIGPLWARSFVSGGCVISEAGGVAVLTPPASVTSTCQLASSTAYDFTGGQVVVEVPQMVDTTKDVLAYLRVADAAQGPEHYVGVFQALGSIYFQYRTGGAESSAEIPYSAVNHRWWRIRDVGGMIHWDTSADGVSWMNRRMLASPISLTRVMVDMSVDNPALAAPGVVHFDAFNSAP